MNMERVKIWTTRILLGFVLITIGFSIGRRTAPRPADVTATDRAAISEGNKVVVYAAHMTFRCPECNQIEWFTSDLINSEFADELESGRLELISIDYMQNAAFARRYDISSSTVIVARFEDGTETGFERLDLVWTKLRDRAKFMDYVRKAVVSALYGEAS